MKPYQLDGVNIRISVPVPQLPKLPSGRGVSPFEANLGVKEKSDLAVKQHEEMLDSPVGGEEKSKEVERP